MVQAFPGPYTDTSITSQGPYDQSEAPESTVRNPNDFGADRSYREGRGALPTAEDLASQDSLPKPEKPNGWFLGQNPYAIDGGVAAFYNNSAE